MKYLLFCFFLSVLVSVVRPKVIGNLAKKDGSCRVRFRGSGACACVNGNHQPAVTCYSNHTIEIRPCYCMFYDRKTNTSLWGNCYFSCFEFHGTRVKISSSEKFNSRICQEYAGGSLQRMGRFCGRCNSSHGLAAYSYEILKCVPCEDYGYKNWLKYFAVSLLPLTVFYILAVLLSFNVTSSSLSGIIMVIQCITSPVQMIVLASNPFVTKSSGLLEIVLSVVCMTSLDFFRLMYSFCLHPKANVLEVLSLEYITALYPFLLIFLTFVLVTAYDKEYRILIFICKPFKIFFHCYRKSWNIKTSLIEIFATFILLSSVKFLGISYKILSFTTMHGIDKKVNVKYLLYLDASIEYFGPKHLPFAVLAISVGIIFVFLPLLVLTFYPCKCFQRCLNLCGGRCQPLHVFMDAFQGHYRTHPRDLRSFSAFYLLLRILILVQLSIFPTSQMFFTSGMVAFAGGIVIAVFKPFKTKAHNTIDTVLLILMGIYFVSYYNLILLASLHYSFQWIVTAVCELTTVSLIVLYLFILLFWKLLHLKPIAMAISKAKSAWESLKPNNTAEFIDSIDSNRDHKSQYPPLLNKV